MYHILTSEQFKREELDELFKITDEIRLNLRDYNSVLSDKVIATLFYEPSTRTRLSFETAVQRLGGKLISTENAREASSVAKGESLLDTIRIIQSYADAIILRHYENDAAMQAASVARVPIINAGSGSGEHPTQALLDVYTIYKLKKKIDGISIAMIGDLRFGRAVHSLIRLLALYEGITFYGLSSETFALPEEDVNYLEKRGFRYIPCKSFKDIPEDVDVLYQTRMQRERFQNLNLKEENFIIDSSIINNFSKNTLLMHPLPRNNEIAVEVDKDPRAVYFIQAENGMYVRMGILYSIFKKDN